MLLHIRVKAAQRHDKLWRTGEGLLAHTKGIPQNGQANIYLINYLAGVFGIPKSTISLRSGHTSSYKVLEIIPDSAKIQKIISALPMHDQPKLFDN